MTMSDFEELLKRPALALIVSLPANQAELAQAAVEGGADAVKLHINVEHRASGNSFGSLERNLDVIRHIRALCGAALLGIVPGDAIEKVKQDEIAQLKQLGVDFVSLYAHHTPVWLLEDSEVIKMLAVDYTYALPDIAALQAQPFSAVEASIMRPELYGAPLSAADLSQYSQIAKQVRQPVVVPTQKRILEKELSALWHAGVSGVMIGAIVTGSDPDSVYQTTRRYKHTIEQISQ